jgi:hypothetical protein
MLRERLVVAPWTEVNGVDESGYGHHCAPPDGSMQRVEHGWMDRWMSELPDSGCGDDYPIAEKQDAREKPD